jgi:predicted nucleotidyltransferase
MQPHATYQAAVDEFVRRALSRYGAQIASTILFGSVARGEAKADSDIDLLVIWQGDESEGWRALTGLAFEVLLEEEAYISVKVIGLEDLKRENPFIKNVMMEGIKIA